MGRIQGLAETPQVLTASQLLKTGDGYVFSTTIAYTGATAGNLVYLRDGLDGSAKILVCFALPAAAGTITKEWPQGKRFETGLYYDEGGNANCMTELTFK